MCVLRVLRVAVRLAQSQTRPSAFADTHLTLTKTNKQNAEMARAGLIEEVMSEAIDGALGAELITAFRKLIENPVMMVV